MELLKWLVIALFFFLHYEKLNNELRYHFWGFYSAGVAINIIGGFFYFFDEFSIGKFFYLTICALGFIVGMFNRDFYKYRF
jgi:hypothetical protein